uniref:Uncharacterized protein n=1 Tax=Arundo donax TaxID=35708 RepID=A0A0A8ZK95_ARUDO
MIFQVIQVVIIECFDMGRTKLFLR